MRKTTIEKTNIDIPTFNVALRTEKQSSGKEVITQSINSLVSEITNYLNIIINEKSMSSDVKRLGIINIISNLYFTNYGTIDVFKTENYELYCVLYNYKNKESNKIVLPNYTNTTKSYIWNFTHNSDNLGITDLELYKVVKNSFYT